MNEQAMNELLDDAELDEALNRLRKYALVENSGAEIEVRLRVTQDEAPALTVARCNALADALESVDHLNTGAARVTLENYGLECHERATGLTAIADDGVVIATCTPSQLCRFADVLKSVAERQFELGFDSVCDY